MSLTHTVCMYSTCGTDGRLLYTVNKDSAISCPQLGCHLQNSPWPGMIYPISVPGRFGKKKSRNLVTQFFYSVVSVIGSVCNYVCMGNPRRLEIPMGAVLP